MIFSLIPRSSITLVSGAHKGPRLVDLGYYYEVIDHEGTLYWSFLR